MKLSKYFSSPKLVRDSDFETLGNADCQANGTLCFSDSVFYIEKANANTNIKVVITNAALADNVSKDKGLIITENPREAFYELHEKLFFDGDYKVKINYGRGLGIKIHPSAFVSERTYIGNNVQIGPNVNILDEVFIDDNSIIEAGCSIGGEGILYQKDSNGNIQRISHAGGVFLGKNVTVLSNAALIRSIFPHTLTSVGDNSIIGVGSIIGHEAQIRKNCVVSGNCVIARAVDCQDNVWIGSSSVIREYLVLGKDCKIKAGSVVVKDVSAGKEVSGNFAVEHRNHLKHFFKLENGSV